MTATNVVAAVAAQTGDAGRAGRRLREAFRSPRLVAGSCIVGVFVLTAIIAPYLVTSPNRLTGTALAGPSLQHWLGTTEIGQDVFGQLAVGTVSGSNTVGIAESAKYADRPAIAIAPYKPAAAGSSTCSCRRTAARSTR